MDKFESLAVISYTLKNRKVSKILTYLLSKVICKIVLFEITCMIRVFWDSLCIDPMLWPFFIITSQLFAGSFIEKQSSFLDFI